MKPYYDHAGIAIYHGDCRDLLAELAAVDAVITDPPYGIGWCPRVNHIGDDQLWHDDRDFEPAPWLATGRYHLFWGAPAKRLAQESLFAETPQ